MTLAGRRNRIGTVVVRRVEPTGEEVILPLALAGILGGIALLARCRVGRTATLGWAWTTAVLGLVMLPVGLLATAGAGAVIVLLRRDDARRWTASRGGGGTDNLTA